MRRGLELADIERGTRIRARYLAALEDERFHILPGEAYARGFLRTYADYLGLDGELYVNELRTRLAPAEPPPEPPRRRLEAPWPTARAGVLLALCGVLALAGLLAWRFARGDVEPVRVASVQPQATNGASAGAPESARKKPAKAKLVLAAARGDCWLLVRQGSADGRVLYEGVLAQGDTLRFARKRLWIRLGAPWNLDVKLNGKRLGGVLAQTGNVLVTRSGVRPV